MQARQEVLSAFPGHRIPDMDTLKSLPYLKAVIDETMRLYPPVPMDPKVALKDDTLPNGMRVNGMGCFLYQA